MMFAKWLQLNWEWVAGRMHGFLFLRAAAVGGGAEKVKSEDGVDDFVSKVIGSLFPVRRHPTGLRRKGGGPRV